jgi:hypothetical protein
MDRVLCWDRVGAAGAGLGTRLEKELLKETKFMMRRLQVCLVLAVFCLAAPAWASVVIPGASTGVTDTFTFVDGMYASATCSTGDPGGTGGCVDMNGELLSAVYRNDTTGNLLFLWQILNTGPLDSGLAFSLVTNWRFFPAGMTGTVSATGETTDAGLAADLTGAGYTPYTLPGIAPTAINWVAPLVLTTYGTVVAPGENSNIWWAYTDAQNYSATQPGNVLLTAQAFAQGQFPLLALNFDTFEPAPASAVPEPASLFLMGSGLVGLASAMRRKLAK